MKVKPRKKKWPGHRTGPLVKFLESIYPDGIPLNELADRVGLTIPAVSSLFMQDNMHLSRAEKIVEAYGFRLRLVYHRKDGNYVSGMEYRPSRNVGNLYGIEEYCQRLNRTIHYISQKTGMKQHSLAEALRRGDIMLDRLENVSKCLDLAIEWEFHKEEEKC